MATATKNDAQVGDLAPDGKLVNKSGATVNISDLWKDSPLVLVFVRHKGCPFCRQYLADITRQYAEIKKRGAKVAVVMMGGKADLKDFLSTRSFPFEVYGNEGVAAYRAYSLKRYTDSSAILNPAKGAQEFISGLSSLLRHGGGIPEGDVTQLGGTFVINTDGKLAFTHRSEMGSDNAPVSSIVAALDKLSAK